MKLICIQSCTFRHFTKNCILNIMSAKIFRHIFLWKLSPKHYFGTIGCYITQIQKYIVSHEISKNNLLEMFHIKVCFLRTYLIKGVDPKNYKKQPLLDSRGSFYKFLDQPLLSSKLKKN